MKHDYVVLKLINGDTIIAILIMEEDEQFTVMFPIHMKPTFSDNLKKEVLVGTPWNPHSSEKCFHIFKSDIMTMSPMNNQTISYYKSLVEISEDDIPILNLPENSFFMEGNSTIH